MKIKYKQFIQRLRMVDLDDLYIILAENITERVCSYVTELNNATMRQEAPHAYCGELRNIINNFILYWTEVMNDAVTEAEQIASVIDKNLLAEKLRQTYHAHEGKHEAFVQAFLPCETQKEQEIFEELEDKYNKFMKTFMYLRAEVDDYDTEDQVLKFTKKYFEISLIRKKNYLEFCHTYMCLVLADHVDYIHNSLIEILMRLQKNLKDRRDESEVLLNTFRVHLYEQNKERNIISRRERRRSEDLAEVDKTITEIKTRIQEYHETSPVLRLEREVQYWQSRLSDFEAIQKTVLKLRKERHNVKKQIKTYNSYKCLELPGSKLNAWEVIGQNLKIRKDFIYEKYIEAARALLTFFAIRGVDRIMYKDNVGEYMLDEYGHQIYAFEHSKYLYHMNCAGEYRQVFDTDKYFYDSNGRYLLDDNGEKVYQCAPCTSTYKLGDEDVFVKTTKDCGHSDRRNKNCRLERKDPNRFEILPNYEPTEIPKNKNREFVDYLWGCFAHILPEVFLLVQRRQGHNPVHHIAHEIIRLKYGRNKEETNKIRVDLDKIRGNIYQKRVNEGVISCKNWRGNRVKRRKPEESDNTHELAIYNAYTAGIQCTTNAIYFS